MLVLLPWLEKKTNNNMLCHTLKFNKMDTDSVEAGKKIIIIVKLVLGFFFFISLLCVNLYCSCGSTQRTYIIYLYITLCIVPVDQPSVRI